MIAKLKQYWWVLLTVAAVIGYSAHLQAMWYAPEQLEETNTTVNNLATNLNTYMTRQEVRDEARSERDEARDKERDRYWNLLMERTVVSAHFS